MKFKLILFLLASITILSCEKDDVDAQIEFPIAGEWLYEYELMSDGTKEYAQPYALLEFTYSDAFQLNTDGSGTSLWYDRVNGYFDWSRDQSTITLSIRDSSPLRVFEYEIMMLSESSMDFRTPKGHAYRLKKK